MRVPITVVPAGFALGATLLQQSPTLPGSAASAAMLVAAAVLAAVFAAKAAMAAMPAPDPRATRLPRWLRQAFAAWPVLPALPALAACLAASLAGFGYAALRAEHRLADALPYAWEQRDLQVRGVVDSLPQHSADATRFAFAVEEVAPPHAIVPHRVSLAWFAPDARERGAARDRVPGALPEVHAGERWTLSVRLKRPHGAVNPHGFDLEAWLLERDLRATGYVRDTPPPIPVAAFAGRAGDVIERARETIRARIRATLGDTETAGVLTALAIGDQAAISDAQWQVFNRTGVTHLISISGLHVTVFAALAGLATLSIARRSSRLTSRIPARKVATLAGALAAWGYVLLAGAEVPAMRTLLMLAVAAAGLWLNRPGTAAIVWLWSLAAVVIVDPWAPLAPGFWLSFGAVGLLLYACGARLRAGGARRSLLVRARHALREATHAQWVVTLGLVPGTLAWFQQVSLVAPLANAIAIPLVTFGVVPLALAGIVLPFDFAWRIADAMLSRLLGWLAALSAWPMAAASSFAPAGWTVAAAIAGVLWIFAPRGVPGRLLGVVLMLPMVLLAPPAPAQGGLRVVVLDVGQGLATLVATARHALLYDAGPRYRSGDAGSRLVVPFLRAAGVARLDRLIVSHADSDHSGGVASVLAALPVAGVMSSMALAAPTGRPLPPSSRCVAGERWEWDGVVFEILHPAASAYDDAKRKTNDLSCVLAVTSAAGRVLFTADIEARSEKEILARGASRLAADVLVVPHHGSLTSSTPAFVAAVAPRIAAVTAGYLNPFGHPRPDVLARYRAAGIAVARTDLDGALAFELAPGERLATTAERERRRRYWYDRRRRTQAVRDARGRPPPVPAQRLSRRSGRCVLRSRRRGGGATASRARSRRTGSRSRAPRRARSACSRRERSSDLSAAARTRSRRSRSSPRR